ncbi:MAG: sugar transferase [Clostridia bacterium]
MNKPEQFKRTIAFLLNALILVSLSLVYAYIWHVNYNTIIIQPFLGKGNWLNIAIYLVLLYFFSRIYGANRVGYLTKSEVMYSQILSLLIVNVITYFQVSLIGRGLMAVLPFIVMTVVQVGIIAIWVFLSSYLYFSLYPPHRTLFIYGNEAGTMLEHKMSTRSDKFRIEASIHIREGLETIQNRILDYDAVIICDVKTQERNKLLKFCFDHSVRTYITPKLSDIIIRGANTMHLFDTPLLLCKNMGLTLEQRFVKRALDLILSLLILIVLSPVMAVTAVCIKVYDRGPVLFRQERCTIDGRIFKICKFRSMVTNAEEKGIAQLATEHDSRITPVGRVIRKLRIDEIPQLFNVLSGNMSLVGPRPERPEFIEMYSKKIPEFSYRLKVKGGLTGYAQILGKYNTTAYDKLKLDLMYIENYSFSLDLKLLLMTFKVIFQRESTEGFSDVIVAEREDEAPEEPETKEEKSTSTERR